VTKRKEVVVAYSGGLDTSFCLVYLRKELGYDVVSVTADTGGFTPAELSELEARARRLKVVEHVTVRAQDAVYDRYVRTLIQGNVLRGHVYPLCDAAERVVQAEEVAAVARRRHAAAVAHGSTGAGNDQVRFDVAFQALVPGLEILTPIRDLGWSRVQEYEYLKKEGVEIQSTVRDYSINSGLWGCTIGGKETHDPWKEIPEEVWPHPIPRDREPRDLVIAFEKGVPAACDGKRMPGAELVSRIGEIADSYGLGRGRIAFQASAALLLITCHRELEKLVLTGWQRFWKDHLADFWGKLLHEGQAFDPVMRDIRALIESSQERVEGEVRVKLSPGRFEVTGLRSPCSMMTGEAGLYGEGLRTDSGDTGAALAPGRSE